MNPIIAIITSSLGAAILTNALTWILALRKRTDDNVLRTREQFASAFQVVSEYKELPYAIRRRRSDVPGEERVRISEVMRDIQARLSFYEAWTRAEDPLIGLVYSELLHSLRIVAGRACKEAWDSPPATKDSDMNISTSIVDLSALKPLESAYTNAVCGYLSSKRNPLTSHCWRKYVRVRVSHELMTITRS